MLDRVVIRGRLSVGGSVSLTMRFKISRRRARHGWPARSRVNSTMLPPHIFYPELLVFSLTSPEPDDVDSTRQDHEQQFRLLAGTVQTADRP